VHHDPLYFRDQADVFLSLDAFCRMVAKPAPFRLFFLDDLIDDRVIGFRRLDIKFQQNLKIVAFHFHLKFFGDLFTIGLTISLTTLKIKRMFIQKKDAMAGRVILLCFFDCVGQGSRNCRRSRHGNSVPVMLATLAAIALIFLNTVRHFGYIILRRRRRVM